MANKLYATTNSEITQREIDNANLSKKMASECIVLLENDKTLPLAAPKTPTNIALYGGGARNTIKGGTGSGDVNTRNNVSVEQGLEEAGFVVTTKNWLKRNDDVVAKSKKEYTEYINKMSADTGTPAAYLSFNYPYQTPDIAEVTDEDIAESKSGCSQASAVDSQPSGADSQASQSGEGCDIAIFVISRISGEGYDRVNRPGDYRLFDNEIAAIRKLATAYDKLIVVLNTGGIIDMSQIKETEGVNAVVLMSQLGNLGGEALADMLIGKTVPSGHLSDTWALDYMDYPSSAEFSLNNDNPHDEYYKDGIFVGYRYFDSFEMEVTYPFGYGLSYTDFVISDVDVAQNGENIVVNAKVTNTGDYAGKEVVQVYVSAPGEQQLMPYQELKAFVKTPEIAPEDTVEVMATIPVRELASYYEEEAFWKIEAGDYFVRVGANSRDTMDVAIIRVAADVVTEECNNVLKLDCDMEEIMPEAMITTNAEDCMVVNLDMSCIDTKTHVYLNTVAEARECEVEEKCCCSDSISSAKNTGASLGAAALANVAGAGSCGCESGNAGAGTITLEDVKAGKATLDELVSQLTIEEMADMCVGTLRRDDGSIVVADAFSIPGAAGDTSSIIKESRKVENLIMADGPAGIRLQPHFKTDAQGKILPGGAIFGDLVEPWENVPDDAIDYYQYCTAIPIGWALAQSWNPEMVEEVGCMIGKEMELFGINLWLAPAMNIHRNPLCGRNFEYYSEDPLLTGKIAAAMTRGVQTVPGRGITIKHFAVNNQEENRYFVNAHVGERALREIYLKGFEIAVKEGKPVTIMTSYNLLNGIHTANNRDLIQSVARDEWGFDGFVMTDWLTSQDVPGLTGKYGPIYPISASTGCIYAGNDIQMPGCRKNVDDIIEAVNSGKELDGYVITRTDLEFCCKNILSVIAKLV